MKKTYILAAAALAVGMLASCSSKKENADSAQADTMQAEEIDMTVDQMPDSVANAPYGAEFFADESRKGNGQDSTWTATASGLKYVVVKEGSGKKPGPTDNVTVHYEGRLTDGTIFDSSYQRQEPTSFPLNGVIKGWTEGLQLMKEGGETIFYIPSDLAYGEQGTPGGPIPPNAPLIFKVELIKINN